MSAAYEVLSLDDLDRIPVDEGLEWRPIRRRLGIHSFGTNAYASERVGGWVVEEHVEGSGHEAGLYSFTSVTVPPARSDQETRRGSRLSGW